MNWTSQQQRAIDLRNCDVLLSAAAGAGKTAVLVERILKHISEGTNIDELLVVTFTNAAAAEMRSRISSRLDEILKQNPEEQDFFYKQLLLLNKAHICTLHSFCAELLRTHFYYLNINPRFRIADEVEIQIMRSEVMEDMLEKYYEESSDDFIALIDAYGGKDDSLVKREIIKLYEFARSIPSLDTWLNDVINKYENAELFLSVVQKHVRVMLNSARTKAERAYQLSQRFGKLCRVVESDLDIINSLSVLLKDDKWDEIHNSLDNIEFTRLSKDKEIDLSIYEEIKELRSKYKDIIAELSQKYFIASKAELVDSMQKSYKYISMLCKLTKNFEKAFFKKKLEKNVLDFNDLERLCLRLLTDNSDVQIAHSKLASTISGKFKEVLVDEYQDINELQDAILNILAMDSNIFMVGDVKQSIYRFRLADPDLFINKYQNHQGREKFELVIMSDNFRCRKNIINGVNFLFEKIMNFKSDIKSEKENSSIKYGEEEYLQYSASYPKPEQNIKTLDEPIEFHILQVNEQTDAIEAQACAAAEKIKSLIAEKYYVWVKERYKPIEYRDIVVIMRSPGSLAEKFVEVFEEYNIPVYVETGKGYFASIEVQTVISLLKVIDNPRQDIPLAAVMRSPIFDFTDEDLARIRLVEKRWDYYNAVVKAAAIENDDLKEKLHRFLIKLKEWKKLLRTGDVAKLIWSIYKDTRYLEQVCAMPGGIQKQANLKALYDKAKQYQSTGFRGLYMFLRFLEKMQENRQDLEPAKVLGENQNVVRIMSIHKSKGLEFPVVIFAGLERSFNLTDLNQDILLHKKLGIGIEYVDIDKKIKYPTIAKTAISLELKRETLEEEMRALYVAMTRSREKLVMLSTVKDFDKKLSTWRQMDVLEAKNFMDWIAPALIPFEEKKCSAWQVIFNEHEPCQKAEKMKQDILMKKLKKMSPVNVDINPTVQQKIFENVKWKYPFRQQTLMPIRINMGEIKHVLIKRGKIDTANSSIYKKPKFIHAKKLLPEEIGTAMHTIMKHVDLKENITYECLQRLLKDLKDKKILMDLEAKSVDITIIIQKVKSFFESDIGQRLLKAYERDANNVQREVPFTLTFLANEVYKDKDIDTDEKILIRGVIDCMWYEQDGWVVLDYKNNYILSSETDDFLVKYMPQLNLYALAVEKILKKKVKAKYLYSFRSGKEFSI